MPVGRYTDRSAAISYGRDARETPGGNIKKEEKKTYVDKLFVATLNIKSWNKHLHIYLQCIEGHYSFIVV